MDKNGRVLISLLIHIVRNAHYCDYCALKHTYTHTHTHIHTTNREKGKERKREGEEERERERGRNEMYRVTIHIYMYMPYNLRVFFYNLSLQGKLIS